MTTAAEVYTILSENGIFADFSVEEFEGLYGLAEVEKFESGQAIVRQDEPGDCMYIVVSGRVKVVHHRNGRDIELAVLSKGDFFGEISLVGAGPRSANVLALENSSLLKISQAAISALAGVYPGAAFKLLIGVGRLMVERLRQSNQRYVDSLFLQPS